MKKIYNSVLVLFYVLVFSTKAFTQVVDYNKVILPEGAENISFEERLVQLAWQNYPANVAIYDEVEIARYEVTRSKSDWLNQITLTGNLNEFNITPDINPNPNNFYPRYNIGVTIPLGIGFQTSVEVKKAKMELDIASRNVEELKLIVRAEVLTLYNEFLKNKSIYELQTQTTELYENNFSLIKTKFLNDEVTINEYNESLEKLNLEKQKKVIASTNYEISKISLERLIGIPIQEVIVN